jgi:short-subunit dehydrogenase
MIVATTLRKVVTATAAAAVSVATLACLDCNPSLCVADLWFRYRPRKFFGKPTGQNQCVWIVGASSGIGEELAYQIAAGGSSSSPSQQLDLQQDEAGCPQFSSNSSDRSDSCSVHLILSSRSVDKLERVAAKCRSLNDCRVTIVPLDVSCPDDLIRAVQTVSTVLTSTSSTLDTLVYNAGVGHLSPALETSAVTAETMWRVNALGPMILIPLLFSHKLWPTAPNQHGPARQRPHLVVTASVASIVPVPLSAAYTAAKHGLLGYLRTLRAERPDILLHVILPGPVDSNFHQHSADISSSTSHSSGLAKSHSVPPESSTSTLGSPKRLCLTVPRCAQLVHSTMMLPYSAETWIATPAVVLWGLYLQQYIIPSSVLHMWIYPALAARRLAMWRAGADLYDPAAWRRSRPPQRTKPPPDQRDSPND